ncbi:MAG TPA: hypothetical protein VJ276_04230, partial [Thermoanaerobaculia bacterium]|nr:hypothetical protein [Thermoanaerobaculia bacterium]
MASLRVGAGRRTINPTPEMIAGGRIFLWGFGFREKPAATEIPLRGIDLSSRALAIADERGARVVLVALDVCAIDDAFVEDIRRRLADSRGLSPDSLAINVSHTHSAPVTMGVPTWPPGFDAPHEPYIDLLAAQVTASIEEALDSMVPASLRFARGMSAIGVNRHFPGQAYDETLDVLQAIDAGGRTLAVAFFHGCHTVCDQGEQLSADFAGIARRKVEQTTGGIALFFQGYAGTIVPFVDNADVIGTQLATDVLRALAAGTAELSGPLRRFRSVVEAPLAPLRPDALQRARDSGKPHFLRWAKAMAGGDAPGTLPIELFGVRLGGGGNEWVLAASSHEVVAEFAAPVRELLPFPRLTLMAYTNRQQAYLPDRRVLADPPCPLFPVCV